MLRFPPPSGIEAHPSCDINVSGIKLDRRPPSTGGPIEMLAISDDPKPDRIGH